MSAQDQILKYSGRCYCPCHCHEPERRMMHCMPCCHWCSRCESRIADHYWERHQELHAKLDRGEKVEFLAL